MTAVVHLSSLSLASLPSLSCPIPWCLCLSCVFLWVLSVCPYPLLPGWPSAPRQQPGCTWGLCPTMNMWPWGPTTSPRPRSIPSWTPLWAQPGGGILPPLGGVGWTRRPPAVQAQTTPWGVPGPPLSPLRCSTNFNRCWVPWPHAPTSSRPL